MRSTRLHEGGTALLYNDHFTIKRNSSGELQSFEFSDWTIHGKGLRLRVIILYRLSYSEYHPVSMSTFFTEFSSYLESVVICSEPLIITGDLNIHVDNQSYSRDFLDLLQSTYVARTACPPTNTRKRTHSRLNHHPVS